MATQSIQVAPQDEHEIEQVSKLYRMLLHDGTATLLAPDGSKVEIPPSLYQVLVKIVQQMREGNAVAVMPLMEELSTQAAADLLGVSRQFFVRECESNKLPVHFTGTHRRVLLKDVLAYKKQREEGRRKAIQSIARQSEELGEYDKFVPED